MTKLETLHKELEAARMEHDAASAHADAQLDHIADLEKQIIEEEKYQQTMEALHEGAVQLKATHDAFVKAGFSDAQAFSLVQTMLQSALAPSAPAPVKPDVLIRALLK